MGSGIEVGSGAPPPLLPAGIAPDDSFPCGGGGHPPKQNRAMPTFPLVSPRQLIAQAPKAPWLASGSHEDVPLLSR